MWALGPAARLVQNQLQSFQSFPPRGAEVDNRIKVKKKVSPKGGKSQ